MTSRIAWMIALLGLLLPALAVSARAMPLQASGGYSFETPSARKIGAGFLALHNAGRAACAITSAHSPVSSSVELHTHRNEGGVMKMRQIDAIEVPAGGDVLLKQGGLHLMLIGLVRPLVAGDRFDVTLNAGSCGTVTVPMIVKKRIP